ncbi:porin family protein [Porphyromonas sp.]|uniref:porin family protein n=1 Tax=Porphyromonas sp. TaxID=1924944 RepID=UPI0026DD0BD0|nr:porin family protein [Porphyromonas sp.]MDO4771120.1 porin family protein [Porphyromonas sp.]
MRNLAKLLALISLLLVSTLSLGAQQRAFRPKVMLGAIGGVNLSNVVFVPSITQGLKQGFDAGIVFRADLDDYFGIWGIWIEVDYSRRGWKDRYDEKPDLYYEREMNFVHVPVMTNYSTGTGPFRFTVSVGPHFGYLLNDRKITNLDSSNSDGIVIVHHDKEIERPFAWGLGGGVGIEYEWKRMVFGLRGNYYQGLGDFFNNARSETFGKSAEQIFSAKGYLLFVF